MAENDVDWDDPVTIKPPEPKKETEVDENDAWDTEEPEHVIRERIAILPPPPASFDKKSPEPTKPITESYNNNNSGNRRNFGNFENTSPRRPRFQDSRNFGGNRGGGFRKFSSTYRPRDSEYSPPRTFKDFVSQQDDKITPEEAVKKFEQYKIEVSLQIKRAFFDKNRTEDWFLIKFHPYYRTLEKIKDIRICRRRLTCLVKFLNFSQSQTKKINISFDINDPYLFSFLRMLSMILESYHNNDIDKFLTTEFERISSDEFFLKNATKRKFNPSSEGETLRMSDDTMANFDNFNLGVEIKNIPVSVNKKVILKVLKRIDGFLRYSPYIMNNDNESYKIIATFKRDTSFADVKQTFADYPISDYKPELAQCGENLPIVKSVRGVWNVNKIVFECMRMALTIIEKLDNEMFLYCGGFPILPEFDKSFRTFDPNADEFNPKESESESESEKQSSAEDSDAYMRTNPVISEAREILDNIAKYDEFSQSDEKVMEVLDRLILYLRLVHSFDFYSFHVENLEHYMPCRIQTVYARKVVDSSSVNNIKVEKFVVELNQKFQNLMSYLDRYEVQNSKKFAGDLKDEKEELDKFMEAKLKEVRPNVWQCLACKKKFQSQEFVRKHLITKHVSIIEAIKLNTIYFNNYFIDSQVALEKVTEDRSFYSALDDIENVSISSLNVSGTKRKKSLLKYDNDGGLDFDSINF